LLILLLSVALLAEAAQPTSPSSAPSAKPRTEIRLPAVQVAGVVPQGSDDEIVCRKEQLLGSRMFKTVCEQKSVVEERQRLDRDALRQIQDMSKVGGH